MENAGAWADLAEDDGEGEKPKQNGEGHAGDDEDEDGGDDEKGDDLWEQFQSREEQQQQQVLLLPHWHSCGRNGAGVSVLECLYERPPLVSCHLGGDMGAISGTAGCCMICSASALSVRGLSRIF